MKRRIRKHSNYGKLGRRDLHSPAPIKDSMEFRTLEIERRGEFHDLPEYAKVSRDQNPDSKQSNTRIDPSFLSLLDRDQLTPSQSLCTVV
ncbi:hypothetical protein V6N13_108686 [Hibiscus sabdariffa]